MAAKRFFYVCAGIFLLALAYSITSPKAVADFNVSNGSHVIGATWTGGDSSSGYLLRSDGTFWRFFGTTLMQVDPNPPGDNGYAQLPIPVSEIAHWNGFSVIAKSGDVWIWLGSSWGNIGNVPAPTTAIQAKTWSNLKDDYRR